MSFSSNLVQQCSKYTDFPISGIKLPYQLGAKNTPAQILKAINDWRGTASKTTAQIQTWVNSNKGKTGIDCSGLVYYCLNEASGGSVRTYFENQLGLNGSLTYGYGISAANLTSTSFGAKKTKAKNITPGCTIRFDNGGRVLVVHGVVKNSDGVVTKIKYTHSNGSKGPHAGSIKIGDETKDLDASVQTWSDSAYSDSQAKQLYNYTIKLNCL